MVFVVCSGLRALTLLALFAGGHGCAVSVRQQRREIFRTREIGLERERGVNVSQIGIRHDAACRWGGGIRRYTQFFTRNSACSGWCAFTVYAASRVPMFTVVFIGDDL